MSCHRPVASCLTLAECVFVLLDGCDNGHVINVPRRVSRFWAWSLAKRLSSTWVIRFRQDGREHIRLGSIARSLHSHFQLCVYRSHLFNNAAPSLSLVSISHATQSPCSSRCTDQLLNPSHALHTWTSRSVPPTGSYVRGTSRTPCRPLLYGPERSVNIA